jgi:Uma2 family endonuclease
MVSSSGMSSPQSEALTPAQYLEIERNTEVRSEYLAGRMYAMSGASRRHNLIALNIGGELRSQLRGRPCEAYVSDMRVRVDSSPTYTYPDVVAVCGEPQFEDVHVDTLLNPTLIVEVLSDSTEKYDRGEKFAKYRRLASLHEYVLVAQDKIRVERYVRDEAQWLFSEISTPDGALLLPSIGCELTLGAIYEKVGL